MNSIADLPSEYHHHCNFIKLYEEIAVVITAVQEAKFRANCEYCSDCKHKILVRLNKRT